VEPTSAPDEDPTVDDLRPETIEGVATRLVDSFSFEELVYRECELDALWTLCDIALEMAALRSRGHHTGPWEAVPVDDEASLVMLRSMFEQAHELAVGAHTHEAAKILQEAARLAASWS
jgi:hypothetical protein